VLLSLAIVRRERQRRRHTEDRLARLLQTADQAGELVAIVNRRGRIEYVNRAVEQATGWTRDELMGKRSMPWLPWYADEQVFDDVRATVLEGTPTTAPSAGSGRTDRPSCCRSTRRRSGRERAR